MKKYEYKVLTIKKGVFTSGDKYAEQMETELNALGADGWELVEISGNTSIDGFVVQVFKRPII